ncbi:MAG: type II toxin-antitoxin system RelE/ParE family toxin [Nitrososphaerales archaeon]
MLRYLPLKKWTIKRHPEFECNLRGIKNRSTIQKLDRRIKRLRNDPYSGKQLRPPCNHLWEEVIGRFRLYYEIHERKQIVLLKAFYPKNLQKRYLRRRIQSAKRRA